MGSAPNGTTVNAVNATNPANGKHSNVRAAPKDVVVISYGSDALRYGRAVDTTPKKVSSLVAFRRKPTASGPATRPIWMTAQRDEGGFEVAKKQIVDVLDMDSRRVGGGRPVPWDVEVEELEVDINGVKESSTLNSNSNNNDVLVGKDAHNALTGDKNEEYDVVAPIWDGKLVFGSGAADTLVRAAIDALLEYIASQLIKPNVPNGVANGTSTGTSEEKDKEKVKEKPSIYIALVIPDTSDRRDVAEIVDAIFRVAKLSAAGVFIHQSSVSCALGAGLATCTVVDIGHSSTTIACVEDGSILADSRVRLEYGAWQMHAVFRHLLHRPHLSTSITTRVLDLVCSLHIKDNDRLFLATVHGMRIKVGLALRTIPAHGLFYPNLLISAACIQLPKREAHERHNADDNYLDGLHSALKRNATASAAVPIGTFANERGEADDEDCELNTNSPLVEAIVWAANNCSNIVPASKYLSAVVLSGVGSSIDRIGMKLEEAIKEEARKRNVPVNNVTVIDGGKGKGDEELAAANAILQGAAADIPINDADDDTDTASLPWKGCAVMVEADAVKDYWVTRDEWLLRNVRVLRERVPFYW